MVKIRKSGGSPTSWLCGIVAGLIGGPVVYALFDKSVPGSFAFGVLLSFPVGYYVGEALDKLAANKRDTVDRPVKQFARQVVGSRCVVCCDAILMSADGRFCEQCSGAVHHACAGRHDCPPPPRTET